MLNTFIVGTNTKSKYSDTVGERVPHMEKVGKR